MSTVVRRKRKATAGSEIKTEFEDQQDVKRKRKIVTHYDPEAMCQEIYDIIRNHRTEDGKLLCESFVRVPKRRTEPTYYEIVSNPIDMLKIQHKIKSEEYDDVDVFAADFQLMLDNARAYYKAGSREAEDADSLWQLLVSTKDRLVTEAYGLTDADSRMDDGASVATSAAADSESADNIVDDNSLPSPLVKQELPDTRAAVDPLELFAVIATANDGSRCITEIFKVLPSRKRYPEYFEVIKEPIDLRTIAQKLEDKSLTNTDDLVKALMLMLNNAKTFNEPGSQIYKDAMTLKKLVTSKRQELAQGSKSGVEGAMEVCATIAHLPSPDDDAASSSDEEEQVKDKQDSPLWALYKAVRQHKDNTGYRLSEPFVKLPNKRQYPDYYQEIKQPMCLVKIRKKLDADSYVDLEELSADLSLLFDNAQQYNIEDSKIYKDAGKLRNVMRAKKKELSGGRKVKDEVVIRVRQDSASNMSDEGALRPRRMTSSVVSAKKPGEDNLKKKLMKLYRTVTQHETDGRRISAAFSELPSDKEYPDYYQVIAEPIDLKEIEHRIKTDQYEAEGGLVSDLELMLKNAKCYNEESSQIYSDAEELEKVVRTATKDWALPDTRTAKGAKLKLKALSPLQGRLQEIYNAVRDFADARGRLLALPFAKLPSKTEYPDYYEVIKKPLDMQRISQRISQSQYENVEELVSDFVLMFDNACKYNEPDSLIYKDALTLQRVCMEKKQELASADDSSGLPDVKAAVQDILLKLFESTYYHKDEEGRCLSDSFLELPSHIVDKTDEEPARRRITFERIQRSLKKGCYKRLDTFQDDMVEVFTYARSISRTDSQLYEDAVELEQWFVRERDELCRQTLLSPALSYTVEDVQKEVDSERKEKLAHEAEERKAESKVQESAVEDGTSTDEVEWEGIKYTIGDFVYVEPRDSSQQPHIVCVERLRYDASGTCHLHGTCFHRPADTHHLATHKFLAKEVLRGDYSDGVPVTKVLGKCCVMFVKDYYHLQPQGFTYDDVYVCESRYFAKTKLFKKIKIWQVPDSSVKLVARDQPLTPVRQVLTPGDKPADSDDDTYDVIERKRENVLADGADSTVTGEDQATFYEQYQAACGWLKTGDFAYKKNADSRPSIIRIDKMWVDGKGQGYVSGPRFMYPHEVDHQPNRVFYKNELFKSDTEVHTPLSQVTGRCSVLSLKDYCSSRLTDIQEEDVYVCECKYTCDERLIRRIVKPVKKHSLSLVVCDDEVYFFKKPIIPTKEPSPLLLRVSSHDMGQDDSNMSSDRLMSATPVDTLSHDLSMTEGVNDSISREKKKSNAKFKSLSGYIVFSGECRKEIQAANPDMSFGDISRLVGLKWRSLPKDEKDRYEARVKKILEDQAANEEAQKQATPQPDLSSASMSQHAPVVHGQPNPPPTAVVPQARPPSPMFVAVPPRSQRLLHSETYLRYIEGLTPTNQNVSNWRRAVQAAPTGPLRDSAALRLPTQWLGTSAMHHNSATEALWALRDLMLKDAVNIVNYNDL